VLNNQRQKKVSAQDRVKWWLHSHVSSAKHTFIDIFSKPISTLTTLGIFAVVLCLPVSLYWAGKNLNILTQHWKQGAEITVFMQEGATPQQVEALVKSFSRRHDVANITYLTPDQALADFKEHTELAVGLDMLDANPLPSVLIIKPAYQDVDVLESLQYALLREPSVASAQLDIAWVMRLQALLNLIEHTVWVLAVLLGVGLLLVTGATIRSTLIERQQEIMVSKLVGATDAFVRRPFLYIGFWLGFCGSLFGLLIFQCIGLFLAKPTQEILATYASNWQPEALNAPTFISIILMACTLGIVGAWLSVGRYLRQL
jgi:cell division transport system permease protein